MDTCGTIGITYIVMVYNITSIYDCIVYNIHYTIIMVRVNIIKIFESSRCASPECLIYTLVYILYIIYIYTLSDRSRISEVCNQTMNNGRTLILQWLAR